MTLKEKIYQHYLQLVNEKISLLEQVMVELKESGANETKSTAGDKHETALAMLQIEQANKRTQLKELNDQKAILNNINPTLTPEVILNGSLVKANGKYFFISTALGKANIEGHSVIALSPQSPLGQQLMGLIPNKIIVLNNTTYIIESIS
ncbi:MAG: hypothetical protein WCG67_10365 [Ferruginibacter sp.]